MKTPKTQPLTARKPRAWKGPRRKWSNVPAQYADPERAALALLELKDRDPEAYTIAKQEVALARMVDGNKAVRTFTCHDTASGAARLYICAA